MSAISGHYFFENIFQITIDKWPQMWYNGRPRWVVRAGFLPLTYHYNIFSAICQ